MNDYVKKLLDVMEFDVSYNTAELLDKLNLKSRETFRKNYLNPALEMNLIQMTVPDKPTSRNQRYIKIIFKTFKHRIMRCFFFYRKLML